MSFVKTIDPVEEVSTSENQEENTALLFVYGTLKRGYGLNEVLTRSNAKFITEEIVDGFALVGWGVPGAVEKCDYWIEGEVWKVPHKQDFWKILDRIEGAYDRIVVTTRRNNQQVFMYRLKGTYTPSSHSHQDHKWPFGQEEEE